MKEIRGLVQKHPENVHALIGNHEEMMRNYLRACDMTWLSHGGRETIEILKRTFPDEEERQAHIDWTIFLPLHFEDDEVGLLKPCSSISRSNVYETDS